MFAIYSPGVGTGFQVEEVVERHETYWVLTVPDWKGATQMVAARKIVAVHDTRELALKYLLASQLAEKQLRPFWQAAVEHEHKMKTLMLEAAWAAAKGID